MAGRPEDEIGSAEEDAKEGLGSGIFAEESDKNDTGSEDVAVNVAMENGREEEVARVKSRVNAENCEKKEEQSVAASNGGIDVDVDSGRGEAFVGSGEVSAADSCVQDAFRASSVGNGAGSSTPEVAVVDVIESEPVVEIASELASSSLKGPEAEEPASSSIEDKDVIASQDFDEIALESQAETPVERSLDAESSVPPAETQSEDGSVGSAVQQDEVNPPTREVKDVDKIQQNRQSVSLEGEATLKSANRIEITLSESPRLTYVASENSNNLTHTSIELDPRNPIHSDSQSAPPLDSSQDNAAEIQDSSDNISGLAEPGEYVGQSREVAGAETIRRLPVAAEEEQAEALLVTSEEAMRKNLKSKSFSAKDAASKVGSGKAAGDGKDDEGDDLAQYMSLPQDEQPEASSPIAPKPPPGPSSRSSASPNPTPEKQLPKTEAPVHKGIDFANEQSGGLIHSKSLDVGTPQRTLVPGSLRPTLSYDGASFFLPIQEVKVLNNSLMPDAPLDLLSLIENVIEDADDVCFTKLVKLVSGEEVFSYNEGVPTDSMVIARLVVDILIAKMGGVEGLDEKKETTAPRVMLRAGPAILGSKLLPWLPCIGDSSTKMSPRTRMAKALVLVLQACTRNRAMCSAAGLLRSMLLTAQMIFTQEADIKKRERWDTSLLFDAFEALGSHCLTVLDLREWLRTVARTFVTGKSMDLILTLERSISGEETRGPSHTFEFDGASSGLLGPGESRWPFTTGYAFATWLYVESFADAVSTAAAAAAIAAAASFKSNRTSAMSAAAAASALAGEGTAHMPRLFSFLSLDSLGVEAYFHGKYLVVDCVIGKGKKCSVHFTFPFQLRRWYFIGLEHTCKQGLLGKSESEMKLYIDGRLCESRLLVFPRPSSLAFCCIGTNPPPAMAGLQKRRMQCPLFAEMGPVYIFKEPIGLDKMTRLCVRGGDALSSFGAGAGVPWFANNEQAMSAAEDSATLDAEIGPALHLLYHPKLLVGRSCQDASPAGASGLHRKPAEVLGNVFVAARIRPTETIWAMAEGGPMALLPLTVGAVNRETLQPVCDNVEVSSAAASLSAPIFRMLALTLQHSGNAEEIARSYAPRLLARLLRHLVCVPSVDGRARKAYDHRTEERDEELVVAVIALAQAPKDHVALKVQLYSSLLLDLKLWSSCSYGLQKKLLSTLADMVITEAETMRGANAVQMLLDGCRRCYWLIPEKDSVHASAEGKSSRFPGELNALVDELLVVVELLVGSSAYEPSLYTDVCSLVQFVLDCPQPNQVARVLHLIYRLVVQPNTAKAGIFAETLLASGGVEMLLTLLQREAEMGETPGMLAAVDAENKIGSETQEKTTGNDNGLVVGVKAAGDAQNHDSKGKTLNYLMTSKFLDVSGLLDPENRQWPLPTEEVVSVARSSFQSGANLGGISISIRADSARNKFRNVDSGDGIMVGIVSLLGALIGRGHLKAMSSTLAASQPIPKMVANPVLGEGFPGASATAVVWLLYALEKAFQAAPDRLMTANVYAALLPAVIRSEVGTLSSEDRLALYDVGHRFEHVQLLLVLLHSLPSAPRNIQLRAIQDILLLACTHPENRTLLTTMPEWPDWLLEILISLYQANVDGRDDISSSAEIEDLVYSFLAIMLEHSMRLKDGWKDVEATIHCAEWLTLVGGPAKGEERLRREESLPIIKRKILGNLVDFAASELHLQTQIVAAAAANVAAEGLSPRTARIEAEAAASLSMSLAENALVLLMLVEDHLRLESQYFYSTISVCPENSSGIAASSFSSVPSRRHSAIGIEVRKPNLDASASRRLSITSDTGDTGSLSLEILASMADEKGQISNAAMERLTASAAAEPFESVRCAFACYGSIGFELAESWKTRSRMWYGVGLPLKSSNLGGGAESFDNWASRMERDENGQWVELPLVKKSITMLQALLLDESGPGGGVGGLQGFGGGAGTGAGGAQLQQLLDSDQPFFAMIRMILVALREEDRGNDSVNSINLSVKTDSTEVGTGNEKNVMNVKMSDKELAFRRAKSSLLWCVLAPLLTMQLFESRRQRVLVAVCIFYSEVWHAVNGDREVLRKQYLETIVPPFAALLRRWRPLLSGIHEFTDAEGQSPLAVEDRPLAVDAPPLEAALAMITPAWAAAFASPPAAMALAMAGAGVSGGESLHPRSKRGSTSSDTRSTRLSISTNFQRPLEQNFQRAQSTTPKDKVTAKAVALSAARDQERAARVGSVRGLGAVAMATSWQRRTLTDRERTRRGNIAEAMTNTWRDYNKGEDFSGINISESAHSLFGVLPAMVETARRMRILEVNRRSIAAAADEFGTTVGGRVWRSLIRRLQEMGALFGAITNQIGPLERVYWKLDAFENSLRMRKRLKQNYKGAEHRKQGCEQPQRTRSDGELPVTSAMAKLITVRRSADATAEEASRSEDEIEEVGSSSTVVESKATVEPLHTTSEVVLPKKAQTQVSNYVAAATSPAPTSAPSHEPATLSVVEPKEVLILEMPGVMIQPLKLRGGMFQVTTRRICFMLDERVRISESGVVVLIGADGVSEVEAGADVEGRRKQRKDGSKDRLWPLSLLKGIYTRRYDLRRSALELFMADRSNCLFNFGTSEAREMVYKAIVEARPPGLDFILAATQDPERILQRSQLTEQWVNREISNFEYLMQLNTLAGRSYNDITQYPVFPWVLTDYTSTDLDLEDPRIYRDLSKPIGALNPVRLKKHLERYENFEDPVIPKFHYDSHYSSAAVALYFMQRVEPYTTVSNQLKRKMNHVDSMFTDIASTWNGVLENVDDVKELVPELFYLPEVLLDASEMALEDCETDKMLGNVMLPPWAANPVDFVQKHRAALESAYVSDHLHEWIDLIFGYKQQGPEAVAAHNVFFYSTYAGTVDADRISNPTLRKATRDQILYFGQIPFQLLTTPHVKRMPAKHALHLQTVFRNPQATKAYAIPFPDRLNVPAAELRVTQDALVTIDMDVPSCHVAVHRWQANTPDGKGNPFNFQHGRLGVTPSSGALIRMFRVSLDVDEDSRYPKVVTLTAPGVRLGTVVAITPDGRYLLTGGHADNSLKVIGTDNAHALETALGHCAPITCLGLSPDGSTMVTGSKDATVILWHILSAVNTGIASSTSDTASVVEAAAAVRSTVTEATEANASMVEFRRRHVEGPVYVLRGHVDEVVCCCVNHELDLVVSSSHSRGVLLHSITQGRFLRRLPVERADMVALSSQGIVVVFNKVSRVLQTYTENGLLVASKLLPSWEGSISSLVVSVDGLHAVIGTNCARPLPPDGRGQSKSVPATDGVQQPRQWDVVGEHPDHPTGHTRNVSTGSSDNSNGLPNAGPVGEQPFAYDPQPAIILLELYTLEVIQKFMLKKGQDITAMALNPDNSNLVVSTANRQLLVFTDPSLSVKVAEQKQRFGGVLNAGGSS